jgi:hypothetical protein
MVLDDMAGITPLVTALRGLLDTASHLRGAAPGGGAGAAAAGGAAGVSSPGGAQRKVHQLMAAVGAGAPQLAALRQALAT